VSGTDHLTAEAVKLIADAAHQSITLRAMGSVGVQMHCDSAALELANRGRHPKDIDLVTRSRDRKTVRSYFENQGYETDRDMLVSMEGRRYLFRDLASGIAVDVFVDVLDFCHRIDVSERMGTGPSLSIEDLLLSKLQIVELTQNDALDLAAILGTHDIAISTTDPEEIDVSYVAGLLANDWGFWRTATGNLASISDNLPPSVAKRADELLDHLEQAPKTLRWKARDRVGERARWWQDVDIPRDTY